MGKSIAEKLSDQGSEVIITYNRTHPDLGSGMRSIQLDAISGQLNISTLPDKLDGVVYCPGRILLKPFPRVTMEEMLEDYQVQVMGAFRVLQQTAPLLKKGGGGSVVLFSTVAVQRGFPFHSVVASSKGAIEGLTRALAAELAPAIRVNCIAPSISDTPLASRLLDTDEKRLQHAGRHPLKRIGTPGDIASLATFLLSEQSSWITGQILHADGGLSTLVS
jgi:NAD(P)-dependent dehydrogenase (short-subunit alcohol dehydrogenase family)